MRRGFETNPLGCARGARVQRREARGAHFGVTPSESYTIRGTFPSGAVRNAMNVVPRDLSGQTITVSE